MPESARFFFYAALRSFVLLLTCCLLLLVHGWTQVEAMAERIGQSKHKVAAMEKIVSQREEEVKNAAQAVVDANRARDRAELEVRPPALPPSQSSGSENLSEQKRPQNQPDPFLFLF